MKEWTLVSERLPKDGEYVLVTESTGFVFTAFYHPEYWIDGAGFRMKNPPRAWMPLPEPYREEKET